MGSLVRLDCLPKVLNNRFKYLGNIEDLNAAIIHEEQALISKKVTPGCRGADSIYSQSSWIMGIYRVYFHILTIYTM